MKVVEVEIIDDIANIETLSIFSSYTKGNNSFCYSLKEIENNKDKIKNELEKYNIKTINYKDENAFLITFDLLNPEVVNFDYNSSLSVKAMNKLTKIDNLKQIYCFFMPSNYVHIFSNKNISVIFNNDLSFTYDFTKYNGLNKLKEMYYKKEMYFFTKGEIYNNLKPFLCINKYLKNIHLYCFDYDLIKFINKELKSQKRKEVNIVIHFTKSSSVFVNKELARLLLLSNKTNENVKICYDEDTMFSKITNNIAAKIVKADYTLMLCLVILSLMSIEDNNNLTASVYEEIEESSKDILDIDKLIDYDVNKSEKEEKKTIKGTLSIEEKYHYLNMIKIRYPNISEQRLKLISNALDSVGLPYYWGGGHKSLEEVIDVAENKWGKSYCNYGKLCGFDCSGFIRWVVYSVTDIDIMEGGSGINYNNKLLKKISKKEMLPGDIAMNHSYITSSGKEQTGHVGIFLYEENGVNYYINAFNSEKGVIISPFYRFNNFYRVDI